ncbi:hypothetical protein WAI453_000599 [Rhynchosporium graminicola]
MNITTTTPVIPRISMRLCKLQASQSRHFSTSRFLYKTTASRNLPQQQAPPPPQEHTAIPPQNTRPAETRPPKRTGPKRDTASSSSHVKLLVQKASRNLGVHMACRTQGPPSLLLYIDKPPHHFRIVS